MHETLWRMTVAIEGDQRQTRAVVRLSQPDGDRLAVGTARRDPADPDLPAVGDRVAAGRALLQLARQLSEAASEQVDGSFPPRAGSAFRGG